MVNKAQQLFDEVMQKDMGVPLHKLRGCNMGAVNDVLDKNKSYYYQWSSLLMGLKKPQQVVELGGAMGVWCIMALHKLPSTSKLYSITLPEGGLEYSFMVDDYDNFYPSLGDDLDLKSWQYDIDFTKTDVWFFDALHTEEHLRAELDLYSPFFKQDTIILIDDIRSFGLDPVWEDIKKGKWGKMHCYDATDPLHYSGYGVCVYGQ